MQGKITKKARKETGKTPKTTNNKVPTKKKRGVGNLSETTLSQVPSPKKPELGCPDVNRLMSTGDGVTGKDGCERSGGKKKHRLTKDGYSKNRVGKGVGWVGEGNSLFTPRKGHNGIGH